MSENIIQETEKKITEEIKCNKIPNIIHYTFCNSNLPQEIVTVINHNKKICKEYKFIFYDDNACDSFIKENFESYIYNAYKKINPCYGAMRADFFRYCVLFIIGGVYIDIKSKINFPLSKLINKNDICILDLPRTTLEPWRTNCPTFEQWLLIFAPKHPYLFNMIQLMTHYIVNNFQPKIIGIPKLSTKAKILHITGPDAFARAIKHTIIKNKKELHRCIDYKKYFQLSGAANYKKMYRINDKVHYSELNDPLYLNK
jgi:mannosyltransferase OCH1-like enzyme